MGSLYTSNEVITIISSIGILITAVGAVIVNVIIAARNSKKMDDNLKASMDISSQVNEVHTQTNSNLFTVRSELKIAIAEIEGMKEYIRDLKSERDKLVHTSTNLNSKSQREDAQVNEVLESIDENTENIDKNTKVLTTAVDKNTKSKEKK